MLIPYGLIVLVTSIALVAWFDFATEASWISKGIVSVLFLLTFGPFLHRLGVSSLVGLFLRVAISIFIIFYRMLLQAGTGK